MPSLRQVVQSLEEVADKDHSWRAELMLQVTLLIFSLVFHESRPDSIQSYVGLVWIMHIVNEPEVSCIQHFLTLF